MLLTTGVLLAAGLGGAGEDDAVGAGVVLAVGASDTCAEGSLGAGVDTVGVPGFAILFEQAQRRSASVTASNRTSDCLKRCTFFTLIPLFCRAV